MDLRYGYAGVCLKKVGSENKSIRPQALLPVAPEELGNLSPEQCLGRFIKSLVWLWIGVLVFQCTLFTCHI